ncbi:MAG: hypothetical protein PHV34_05730 [Verrucomicrobiae bacterium]|nr:hypothetical protein [Verrucomicrobiae bacterium]
MSVEVFAGNTQDAQTVQAKIAELKKRYGITEMIFVGDRGMVAADNFDQLKDMEGLQIISALTHPQIRQLLADQVVQMGLFDDQHIAEVVDPQAPDIRYCLCRNPQSAQREKHARDALMKRTAQTLNQIVNAKRDLNPERIGECVAGFLTRPKWTSLCNGRSLKTAWLGVGRRIVSKRTCKIFEPFF